MSGNLDDAIDVGLWYAVFAQSIQLAKALFGVIGGDIRGQGHEGDDGTVQFGNA